MPEMVMIAVGPDRLGLVSEFSRTLHAAGANLADSRMMNLHGQFAMLLLVQGDQATLQALRTQAVKAGSDIGLTVTPCPIGVPETGASNAGCDQMGQISEGKSRGETGGETGGKTGGAYRLKTYSTDQPGIVYQITKLLQEHGVNIEELETRQESAPFAGTMLFTMHAKLTIPASVAIKPFRQKLQDAADAIHCDLDLEPAS